MKPFKLNESVVSITNTSWVYLLTCVWVFCFWSCKNLSFHAPCLSIIPKQLGVGYNYWAVHFKSWFYVWHIVETYTKCTSSKRFCLVTSSRLIHVYFTNEKSFLLQQKLKSGIVTNFFFFFSQLTSERRYFISFFSANPGL